ncbi:hypothetical protein AAHB37_04305 [Glutamicibacter halophytocola]|uniref:hypothetical protein n=1 Tax=Glutamicibacter halophytocola TaxID=1933880 RepID=UPI00321ACCC5
MLSPRSSGEIDSQLVSGSGETLDSISRYSQVKRLRGSMLDPERNESSITASVQSKAVAMLLSESALDSRKSLRELGIGYIVLNETGESVPATVRALDSATGLAAVGQTDSGWLWRVDYGTSAGAEGTGFARIVGEDGAVTVLPASRGKISKVQIPASDSERTLVLATAADPKLRASIDGEQLRSVAYPEDSETRWAQAFEIPAGGGELSLSHKEAMAMPFLILACVVLLITVLLAIPVPSSRRFANYRNSEYRFREPRAEDEALADASEVLAAAEVHSPPCGHWHASTEPT